MTSFVVSARKHRPVSFEHVFGQAHVTTTLAHAIKEKRPAQAMLFCGPRGVGKTSCARIFANQLNGFAEQDPTHTSSSLNIFELDAASNNSVEDVRNLIEQVRFPPQAGVYKVYIIDEVHMLSQQAFNAFLKTLEEPPPYAIFILATTEKQKVLPTVLSRCQVFHFKRISVPDIVSCLQEVCKKEHLQAEEKALYHIAHKADGALRDALSMFDMLMTFCKGELLTYAQLQAHFDLLDDSYFFDITKQLAQGELAEGFLALDKALQRGVDLHHFLLAWSEVLRDLLLAKDSKTQSLAVLRTVQPASYQQHVKVFSSTFLLAALEILNTGEQQYKQSQYPRLHVELLLTKINQIGKKETPAVTKHIHTANQAEPPSGTKAVQVTSPSPSPSSSVPLPNTPSLHTPSLQSTPPSLEKEAPSSQVKSPTNTQISSANGPKPGGTHKKPYTVQEKLAQLTQTYPALDGLQEQFDLDVTT